jgi:thiamine-phosphate diphosphorylase
VTAVQLRAKHLPAARLLELTEELHSTLTIPVYVNDRADVALAGGARGVHVGAEDLSPIAVRAFAGDALRIGVSVGTEEEAARVLNSEVDYWSIGSIYQTGTKIDAGEPIGPTGFRELSARAPRGMTIIAIGGITAANAGEVLDAGADGVAVSSAVFGAADVERAARTLRTTIDERRPA